VYKRQIEEIPPLFIKFREIIFRQPIPPNMFGKRYFEQPITTSIAFHINHWVNLLNANQMEIIVKWVEFITSHPFWVFYRLILATIAFIVRGLIDSIKYQSISSGFSKGSLMTTVMRWFNVVGKGCEIHPSAILEFCIIGDNVKIGPQSYLRASVVNRDVIIEEKTKITFSIIDRGCYVSQITILNGVAAYPDGDVCIDGMQFCMSGRNVKLTGLARPMDLKYGGRISVMQRGKPVEVNLEILGSCFGHRCFIGPDIYIAPGREIPNDAVIVPHISDVLYKIPESIKPNVPMVVENSTLVELKSEKKKE
jgi:acetyltransferase-like isoleucine patch superfamily enzyme